MSDDDLLARQAALQDEARQVLAGLAVWLARHGLEP
jgi:hypothetical protein